MGIELQGVSKRFDRSEVIRAVDLVINDGEFCVIVGPSGCGKSTLLRLIAGLEEVSSGHIRIGGREVTQLPPAERDVAMVFQSYALYPHMSVYDNLAFGLRYGRGKREGVRERVEAVARSLHIEELLGRRPAQLSGGQRQRVAIGRAIVREPQAFLLDEPLSNLDAALRVRMRLEFVRLHRRLGTTMVYVTHDQVEAMTLADRMVVIDAGAVVQVGRPLELYHRPRNRFVAGFIGSPQMNFLPGQLAQGDESGVTVQLADGSRLQVAAEGSGCKVGEKVTLGIRPEHLSLEGEGDNRLQATVSLVEQLGDHTLIHLEWQEAHLVVRGTSEQAHEVGDRLLLGLPRQHCHLFDEAGEALPRLDGGAVNPGSDTTSN
jgi:multiple sugar transport system ATP-binding protein